MFLTVGYAPVSSIAPRPLGAAYVPILLSEVEQKLRPSGNGDREAIVVRAGLCDGEGERAYTVYDPILGEEKYQIYFNASQEQKSDTGQFAERQFAKIQFAETQFAEPQFLEREGQFVENYSANCP